MTEVLDAIFNYVQKPNNLGRGIASASKRGIHTKPGKKEHGGNRTSRRRESPSLDYLLR